MLGKKIKKFEGLIFVKKTLKIKMKHNIIQLSDHVVWEHEYFM